jgi:dipeptide/tripeptide permease
MAGNEDDAKVSTDESDPDNDESKTEEKKELRYPFGVFFILSSEFCERFSYYGKAIFNSII